MTSISLFPGQRARNTLVRWMASISGLCVLGASLPAAVIDFEDVGLPMESANPATAADRGDLIVGDAVFNRSWSEEFDCCPSGWAVSNQVDQIGVGYSNAFSAYVDPAGGAHDSSQYAVANNLQRGESTVQFGRPVQLDGMYVSNTTYTYHAVVSGDDGAGFVSGPFTAGDWLRLDVIGIDSSQLETGRVSILLADYRSSPPVVLDAWNWLDLSPLGDNVRRLEFEMSSTDVGPFGMNTPAYFAVDDLTYAVVPEPQSFILTTLAAVALGWQRARKSDGRRIPLPVA